MKKIETVIQASQFENLKEALLAAGVEEMTVSHVQDLRQEKGPRALYRGREFTTSLPKLKIEAIVSDDHVNSIVRTLKQAATSRGNNNGRVFISPVEEADSIRTEQTTRLAA